MRNRHHRIAPLSMAAVVLLGTAPLAGCYDTAPHLPFPPISRVPGDVLSPLRLVSLVSPRDPFAGQLVDVADRIMAGEWIVKAGREAGVVPGKSVHAASPSLPGGPLEDAQLTRWLRDAVDGGRVPAPDGNTLYLIWLPDGFTLLWNGRENTDCRYVRGYHRPFGDGGDVMAVIPRCPDENLDDLSVQGAHELIEAASDPARDDTNPGTPRADAWAENVWIALAAAGAGIADLCDGTRYRDGGILYPRVYSDRAAKEGGDPCIPAQSTPYFNTSSSVEWYPLEWDGSTTVPITGWSTGEVPPWRILMGLRRASDPTIDFNVKLQDPANPDAIIEPLIDNRQALTLSVRAGSAVDPGFWAAIEVDSYPEPGSREATPDADRYHRALFGIYVIP